MGRAISWRGTGRRSDMERTPTRRKMLALLAASGLVAAAPARAADCRIAVLGDSLAAGYGLPPAAAFPARLEAALRARGFPCAVLDAGVSGDTSAGGAARVGWVLADRPSHLLVELGGNDALRALPPEQLEANLERIVAAARTAGVPVMIAGMLAPTNLGPEYGAAFAAAYRRVVDRHDLAFYPFFLDGLVGRPELFQADGIHPNAAGVAVIVEGILPTVEAWLVATGVSPGS
ncbi:MAG: arylesterase [Geminicoccaceae bacterium]|nr:arylesterase [Geminicoccaceae bacterium]